MPQEIGIRRGSPRGQFVTNLGQLTHNSWAPRPVLPDKLEFDGFVELKMFQRVRRERIYPFRPRSGINARNYLTKGQVIRISRRIHDKNIRKSGFADGMSKPIPKGVYRPFPVQRTTDANRPFGTDKSVPYESPLQIPICRSAALCRKNKGLARRPSPYLVELD